MFTSTVTKEPFMGLEMQIDSWLVMLGVLKWDVTCCSFNAEQEYKRGLFPVVKELHGLQVHLMSKKYRFL